MDVSSSREFPKHVGHASAGGEGPPSSRPAWVRRGFLGLAGVTWTLLVFGATVRVHGAGLSCPDWPLCFGQVVPEMNMQVFLEWGHRVLAGTISMVFLGLGVWVLSDRELRGRAGLAWGVSSAVLLTQIILGGLTVLHLLVYWSVTLHLLVGNLFLISLLFIAHRVSPRPVQGSSRTLGLSVALAVSWVLQMALGGLVSSNHAGMACTEWPTCNGGLWAPALDGIVGLQLAHRAGAYLLLVLSVAFAWSAHSEGASRYGRAVLGLVLAQAALGITNVLMEMPVELAVLHSATADLIGIVIAVAVMRLWARAPGGVPAVAAPAPMRSASSVLA